ncbi:hypothetical protein [Paraburkholderia sp. J7]|uniref:hypothetical protein n=1 Tax=Paraburkholderia sp. J7 TaxID=2805438 RepID=UPI002AB5FD66|nr:hypothetical protein [Paraburkholderia sp. J7]
MQNSGRRTVRFLERLRSLAIFSLSAINLVAIPPSAEAAIPPARESLDLRVIKVRERLQDYSKAQKHADESRDGTETLAQWFKWPNWGNWPNYWNNWRNWFNG